MTTIGTRLCRVIDGHAITERDPGMSIAGEKVFALVSCKYDGLNSLAVLNGPVIPDETPLFLDAGKRRS